MKMQKKNNQATRREFIQITATAASGIGLFHIVPRRVLGGDGHTAPSDTVTRAVIGLGRGHGFTIPNKDENAPVTLAVCDVDSKRLGSAVAKAGKPCKGYKDFREVMDRDDIDTIFVMTPPHWHALVCLYAAQSGKDLYCEKPMTRFIAEGQYVADSVRRYDRVFQIGTFGRYGASRSAGNKLTRKIMGSGFLPKEKAPVIKIRNNFKVKMWSGLIDWQPQPIPKELDWNMYLGPAPYKPYHRHRTHGSFRGYWDFDGGGLADMGQHCLDGVQWTLNKDHTSPVEVQAHAPFPAHPDACGMWGWVEMKYADGTTLIFESGEWGERHPGTERGYPSLNDLSPEHQKIVQAIPDEEPMIGNGQWEFEQAVKERRKCGGNADVSNRCATLLHLANIAIRTGRKLRYDPEKQQFIGDEEANRLVNVPMRAPWHLA